MGLEPGGVVVDDRRAGAVLLGYVDPTASQEAFLALLSASAATRWRNAVVPGPALSGRGAGCAMAVYTRTVWSVA
ncbi:hypothetical protein [Streptomyces sp. TE5632]